MGKEIKQVIKNTLEIFYYGDAFYEDIYGLINDLDIEDKINELPDDYVINVYECELRPIVKFTSEYITDMVDDDSYSENNYENEYDKIKEALDKCVDFKKLNSLIPELWFPTNDIRTITKADLLEAIY